MRTIGIRPVCFGILLLAFALTAGAQEPQPPVEEGRGWWDEVLWLYERAKQMGDSVPKDVYQWAQSDLHSIGDWEYRVADLPGSAAASLEQALNELGADRWEVIWIEPSAKRTRAYLKRPVRTYLNQQLPVSQIMKLFTGAGAAGESGN